MSSVAVRVSEKSHSELKSIADSSRKSVTTVIDDLVEEHKRMQFQMRVREAIARTKRDPEAWQEVQDEQRVYDNALMDGLED